MITPTCPDNPYLKGKMPIDRRKAIKQTTLGGLSLFVMPSFPAIPPQQTMKTRPIPSTGEALPIVGVGTWQTFDVGTGDKEREPLMEVLSVLRKQGGKVIDSSPMYGRSEAVVGELTSNMQKDPDFFYATKVWIRGREAGIDQMNTSMREMARGQIDLMQIHNLVDWQTHMPTLKRWKREGKIRYWGITHYTNSAHDDLERIIKSEKPDFAQFNYSITSRHAERYLLNTCAENGTAVLVNQPYDSGSLFGRVKGKDLPGWAAEYDIKSWGQYFLKYILSQPAVTCVIPGTSNPKHMLDNSLAGFGRFPDAAGRKRMMEHLETL